MSQIDSKQKRPSGKKESAYDTCKHSYFVGMRNIASPGSLRGRGSSVEEGFKREPLGVPFVVSFFCEAFSFFCSKERKCVEPTGKFCRKISGACRHGKMKRHPGMQCQKERAAPTASYCRPFSFAFFRLPEKRNEKFTISHQENCKPTFLFPLVVIQCTVLSLCP